jgi:hypothetical protein
MHSHLIRAIDGRCKMYTLPCVHCFELPSLTRPGLFGD